MLPHRACTKEWRLSPASSDTFSRAWNDLRTVKAPIPASQWMDAGIGVTTPWEMIIKRSQSNASGSPFLVSISSLCDLQHPVKSVGEILLPVSTTPRGALSPALASGPWLGNKPDLSWLRHCLFRHCLSSSSNKNQSWESPVLPGMEWYCRADWGNAGVTCIPLLLLCSCFSSAPGGKGWKRSSRMKLIRKQKNKWEKPQRNTEKGRQGNP